MLTLGGAADRAQKIGDMQVIQSTAADKIGTVGAGRVTQLRFADHLPVKIMDHLTPAIDQC